MSSATGQRVLLVAGLVFFLGCAAQTDDNEAAIKKAILRDRHYDVTTRPPNNRQGPTATFITLMMRSFQIDEYQLTATINAWTVMVWMDRRLTWQPSDYGNTRVVLMYSSQIWLPDIYLMNGVTHLEPIYMHAPVPVNSTGLVVWVTPSTFRVRCQKEMANWPYDQQKCTVILSSWSLDRDTHEVIPATHDGKLVLSNDMVKTDSHWRVTSVDGSLVNTTYNCCPGSVWHELHVEMHVARVSLLYAMSFILPCLGLTVHVLLVFWIPPDSPAKVKVATIHSVALIFFLFNLFWWMPPVGGTSVPKLVSFVSASLSLSVVSAVAAVVASNLVTRCQPPPAPVLAVFTGLVGTVLRLGDLNQQLQSTRAPFAEDGAPVQDKEATAAVRRAEWRLVAAGADRCLCLLQLAVFVFLSLACLT
ncbi:acetylcholine receptor subunit alpha-type acr-16-like [Amphibalanus amphitrite]|uniref:acetylcholine receptor subunit alpha-type acr-16-like n=2 Tax=Amphibalanus amphitrite TaxID=1232801 RepID=UPI001C913F8D|nr:acetylcholine receptor subunit alpha-type acr-16-like isoform X1 [Amphibalanus amphitrite]XP_043222718.1 acetylcholine receptor subunit alpha-type acr-16-like [Amphibalanus amphitrite]